MSNAPNAEYGGTLLSSDRLPENRMRFLVDAEGYVVGAPVLDKEAPPMAFFTTVRKLGVFPPPEIAWPTWDWPRDTDGRGYSILEMQHHIKSLAA